MNIIDKLIKLYKEFSQIGYTPLTIGVSDEEYEEYKFLLKEMAERLGFTFTDTPTKLTFRGIELKKYGKQTVDENRKK